VRRHPARVDICGLCKRGFCDEHYIEWLRIELDSVNDALRRQGADLVQSHKALDEMVVYHQQHDAMHVAEVERLRAELGSKMDQAAVHYGEVIERLQRENTAIREELGRPTLNAATIAENVRLTRKVERLRVEMLRWKDAAEADGREVERLRAALEQHHENDFIVRDGVCAVCKEEAPKERPPSPGISAQLDMEDKFPSIREGGEKDG